MFKIAKSCKIVNFCGTLPIVRNNCYQLCPVANKIFTHKIHPVSVRTMAQKSITSFFKITPKKAEETKEEKLDESLEVETAETSPVTNGKSKRSSKRQRLESSGSETSTTPPSTVDSGKKKVKRQRIESSGSEAESSTPTAKSTEKSPAKDSSKLNSPMKESPIKESPIKENSIKESPIKESLVKESPIKESPVKESPIKESLVKESPIKESPVKESPIKESSIEESPIKESPVKVKKNETPKTYASPKTKKSKAKTPLIEKNIKVERSPQEDSPKKVSKSKSEKFEEESPKEKKTRSKSEKEEETPKTNMKKKKTPVKETKKAVSSFFTKKEVKKEKEEDDDADKVAEADYNPAKAKYHPITDACWSKGEQVPYLALAKTMEVIEATSGRLKIIEYLSNYLRSVIVLTPEDLLPSVYMCLNQLAPAYHSLELGIAETYLMKAIGQCTGRSLAQVKAAAQRAGDLGAVAAQARATQRTMFPAPPLKLRKVFNVLKEVANMTGQASVTKKISKIQSLYIACRDSEARYLIRSLEGKLRIGLAEQSVLQALALAVTLTPPSVGDDEQILDAGRGLSAEELKARVDQNALIIKTTYCECPNYERLVPELLARGVAALPQRCKLAPGVPLKPMLAHPTRGVREVFTRFENEEFTCEWKYDGERAQIHVPGERAPDLARAAVFSRNQENNTSKYPDVLRRLPSLLKDSVVSCVLDCEAVAYDTVNKQILPFQVLSTRKRKDAAAQDITVQVCVFVFDLLFLNGRALVRAPLRERRRLLRDHFNTVEGEWQFATSKDCASIEDMQQFLEEAVRGSCEGLMVKALAGDHAKYDIARRSHNWLKLKKDYLEGVGDTIDAVVLGGYRGKGRRAGVYGGFLLACYAPQSDEFQSLCKIGTGFSDEDLQHLSRVTEKLVIDGPKSYYRYDSSHAPDAWFSAALVLEVRGADLTLSPAHRAACGLADPDKGVSLRFPRFIRIRDDKTPEQATSAEQIAEMYLSQDQVKNQTNKTTNFDDFY